MSYRPKPGFFRVLFSVFLVASMFGFVYLGQQVYENSDPLSFSIPAQTAAVSNSVLDSVFCFFGGVFGFPCEESTAYVPTVTEPLVENNLPPETPALVPTYSSENNETSGDTVIQNVTNEYVTNPVERETIREVVIRNEQVSSSDFITRTEYERQVDGIMRSIENVDTSGGGGTNGIADITSESIEDLEDVAAMTKVAGDLLTWTGSTWSNIATSSLGISGGGAVDSVNSQTGVVVLDTDDISEGTNQYFTTARARDVLSSSAVGLSYATSTGVFSLTSGYDVPLTASTTEWSNTTNLVNASSTFWNTAYGWGDHGTEGYLTAIASSTVRGMFSSSATGLTYDSGTGVTSLTSGYNIPLTASTTAWNTAYNTVTAGSASWDSAAASTTALTPSYLRGLFSNSATGLTYNSSTGATSLTAGYTIPLTASTTEWASNSSQWTTSGSDIYYNTGNVGVGTTTPTAVLDIQKSITAVGSVAQGVRLQQTLTSDDDGASLTALYINPTFNVGGHIGVAQYGLIVTDGNTGLGITNPSARLSVQTEGFADILNLFESGGTEVFTVLESGNVGIGSTTPSSRLTVGGNAWLGGNITSTGTLAVLGTATSTFAGNVEMSGSIIPSADITYDLGTPTRQWRDVYIGPGSLYINGKKVLEDVSDTITITTDLDQNLAMKTTGIGTILLSATSTGSLTLESNSGNINMSSVSGNLNIGTTGSGSLNFGTIDSGVWNGTAIDISDYTNLGVSATGLSLSGDSIALTAGYTIPLTASTTEWDSKISNITGLLTAGTNVTVTGSGTSGDPYSISAAGTDGVASSSVAFSVHKNGTNQTVTSGVETLITWSTEDFDTNNNFASNRFTPTIAGKYIINGHLNCLNSTSYCQLLLRKNGTSVKTAYTYHTGETNSGTISVVVDMNGTTDYLEMWGINGGGTTFNGAAIMTNFSGALIAPANGLAGGWSNDETQSYLADYTDLVAIGTTTAAAKLDIWGSAGSTDILGISSSTGTRLLTVTAAGNAGIKTTSPDNLLHIESDGSVVSGTQLTLEGRYSGYGAGINFVSRTSSGGTRVSMGKITADGEDLWNTTASTQDAGLRFFTAVDGTLTEKMRITSSGFVNPGADNTQDLGTASLHWSCLYYDATNLGTCSSDSRLKSNVQDMFLSENPLASLTALRPRTFEWNENLGVENYGLIAQEVLAVAPELVEIGEDGFYQVKYGYLQYLTIEAIKELNFKLEDLATTTAFADLDDESFTKRFFDGLIVWFADATNGIGTMMASVFQASDMICVDDECLTADDIRQLKDKSNLTPTIANVVEVDDGNDDADAGDEGEVTTPLTTVLGCIDELATNYNQDATEDDGSCEYGDGEPSATSVLGCTDIDALNYNSSATEDDGACEYEEEPVEEPVNPVEPAEEPVQDEEEEVVEAAPSEEPATI